MAKDDQAKVLSNDEFEQLLLCVEQHRYPEKNTLICQLSFKLGLRVQELSLLRVLEVAPFEEVNARIRRGENHFVQLRNGQQVWTRANSECLR